MQVPATYPTENLSGFARVELKFCQLCGRMFQRLLGSAVNECPSCDKFVKAKPISDRVQ